MSMVGGSWVPLARRQEVLSPWHDYSKSDPLYDVRRAKETIEKATNRPAVAMTVTPDAHKSLECHPDVVDRFSHGHASSLCVVTVARGGAVISETSYHDPADTCDILERVFDIPAVQVAIIGWDCPGLVAIIYNDVMAVQLCLKEDASK